MNNWKPAHDGVRLETIASLSRQVKDRGNQFQPAGVVRCIIGRQRRCLSALGCVVHEAASGDKTGFVLSHQDAGRRPAHSGD